METIEYRKKIDEAYNTDQSVLFRWQQTEKFLEPKESLNAGLDIGERTALTKRLEDLYNINFDSTNIDLDWDIPSRFNATMIGFIFTHTNRDDSISFRTEVSRMSMKHVFEIDNIFDKNFYLETKGRMADNILE